MSAPDDRQVTPGQWLGWTAGTRQDGVELAAELSRTHGYKVTLRRTPDDWEAYAA